MCAAFVEVATRTDRLTDRQAVRPDNYLIVPSESDAWNSSE